MNGILFDIGGTNLRLAVTRDGKHLHMPTVIRTPKEYHHGLKAMASLVPSINGGKRVSVLSGGITGPIDAKLGGLSSSTNLPRWVGKPLVNDLRRLFHAPVYLNNDAALGGLGEAHFGAGRGYDIVVFVTVSTGVGGTRIIDGRIDRAASGFEPGHQIIAMRHGRHPETLEHRISGGSIKRRYKKNPWEIRSQAVWKEVARELAVGLVNMTVTWSPEVVILGGAMFKKPGIDVRVVQRYLKEYLTAAPVPIIVESQLRSYAGLYGAMAYLKLQGAIH